MNAMQKFFTRVFPAKWAAAMEAESRTWRMRCETCGHEDSLWDRGGIRWKSTHRRFITLAACDTCGRATKHTVYFPAT